MRINRNWIAGGATAAALAAVVTGTAAAQSTTTTAPADQSASSDTVADEGPEDNEREEVEEPTLHGSITAPDNESLSEDAEAELLAQIPGLISESDAIAAATADGGSADVAVLGNENGSVVHEVEVTAADGTVTEVAVDAGNGDVLARESDDQDEQDDDDDVDDVDDVEDDEADQAPETSESEASTTP